jgi:hypothetical protein
MEELNAQGLPWNVMELKNPRDLRVG